MSSNYDLIDGVQDSNLVYQKVKEMEKADSELNNKRQSFDNDYERLQRDRGNLLDQRQGQMPGQMAR